MPILTGLIHFFFRIIRIENKCEYAFMSKPEMDDATFLKALAATLAMPGMPSQTALAKTVGVDQPLVSRAMNGELRRVTPRVRRLCDYASMRAAQLQGAPGSDPPRLPAAGEMPEHASKMAAKALEECQSYLADGCDPVVLRDQIAILRRLQGPMRGQRLRT